MSGNGHGKHGGMKWEEWIGWWEENGIYEHRDGCNG